MGARYGAGISPMKSRSVEDKGTPVNGDRNGVLEPAGPLGTWSHRGNQVTVRWLQVLHGIKSPSRYPGGASAAASIALSRTKTLGRIVNASQRAGPLSPCPRRLAGRRLHQMTPFQQNGALWRWSRIFGHVDRGPESTVARPYLHHVLLAPR
ncbi:hypothetical protein PMIN06_001554 [Paraphaeosphaeria minitans]